MSNQSEYDVSKYLKGRITADLHCHTKYSDGSYSPKEVVFMAKTLNLKAVGITDHDTISGWKEAEQAGQNYGIEIIRGVELNTDWMGKEVHILGYEMDKQNVIIAEKLIELGEAREERLKEILIRLRALDIILSEEEVKEFARGDSVGRPHIAQALIAKGYAKSVEEAFVRYLEIGAPAYVLRLKLTPEGAIRLIRQAGGVAVLAHPGLYRVEAGIKHWVEEGLQGIEAIHSEHSEEDVARYLKIGQNYHLIITGGSDFHGEKIKPNARMGKWGVDMTAVEQIRALAKK